MQLKMTPNLDDRLIFDTSDENCKAVEYLVMSDRRLRVDEIAASTGISHGSVETILHEKLGMFKVCARWVPRSLTLKLNPAQMRIRVDISRELLERYESNPVDFCSRTATGDETWLHYWDPESNQTSRITKAEKFRKHPSAGKSLATICWDTKGLITIDYMPHGSAVTG